MSRHRVTAFLGLQGGCGTTTLAIAHATAAPERLLVDADFAHGDIAERLRVDRTHATPGSWVSGDAAPVAANGVSVAVSPSNVLAAERFAPETVEDRLRTLAREHALVVDLGSRIDAQVARMLRVCDLLVLVSDGRPAQPRLAADVTALALQLGVSRVELAAPRISSLNTRRLFAARCGVPLAAEAHGSVRTHGGTVGRIQQWLRGLQAAGAGS